MVQILSSCGYGNNYAPVISLMVNIINVLKIVTTAVLIVLALYYFIVWLLNKFSKKKREPT